MGFFLFPVQLKEWLNVGLGRYGDNLLVLDPDLFEQLLGYPVALFLIGSLPGQRHIS
ncbi:MAG: hypothetical protein HYY30_08030 [Chloroflexi bacterium]|nr:hypothetical protein [Chloroflexota bacterium]